MEALKRRRRQQRREFLSLADSYENGPKEEAEVNFSMLSDAFEHLQTTELTLRDFWCEAAEFSEPEYEADQEKAMAFRKRWISIRSSYEREHKPDNSDTSLDRKSTVKSRQRSSQLPRLELQKFDGDVKKWLSFWGQFQKIDADDEIDDVDKFQYLLQSMTENSSARKLVESYPPCGRNYKKALDSLKLRFAREDILIETYVRGLLNLVLLQQKGHISSLSQLHDDLQTHLQALETLGVVKDKYASILYPMIRTWNRIRITATNKDDISTLIQFLREEVESEERISMAKSGFLDIDSNPQPRLPTACFVMKDSKGDKNKSPIGPKSPPVISCLFCEKEQQHSSSECYKAGKMTLKERLDFIKAKNACSICMKTNHSAKRCRSFPKCLLCAKRHFILLCPDLENSKNSEQVEKSENLICQQQSTTLLQTFSAIVTNDHREICVRALIDSRSQRSYVKSDLIKTLDLKAVNNETISQCLFGGVETKPEKRGVFNITMKNMKKDFCFNFSALESKSICSYLPKVISNVITKQLIQHGIELTETKYTPDEVTVLVGADYLSLLFTSDYRQFDNLTAIRTKMGWTLQGPVTGVYSTIARKTTTLHCLSKIDLSDLWSLEALGINDPGEQISKSARERDVLASFVESIKINDESRYEVCLPWKDAVHLPHSNYEIALKRLLSTTARLKKLNKMSDYNKVFNEWLDLQIIEVAPSPNTSTGVYLPHHAVIKESSQTTKIRPVFDASAKDYCGNSLNGCLEKGRNLIELIPDLLISFRKEAYGVVSDVAKAFLQISLSPKDRDYLKFLWWADVNDEGKGVITYRHRRVVFGVTSSPFHLAATISYHLDHVPCRLQNTAMKLKRSFYVDNCVTSLNSVEAMNEFIKEAKEIMLLGKFDLRCWVTAPITMSVLGIVWNTVHDEIFCNISSITGVNEKLTKRSVLSLSQKIFDPIGVCCPTTIVPKMLLQESWAAKTTWDEELPDKIRKEFEAWQVSQDCKTNFGQHYSACIFLRSVYYSDVYVSLVLAKSRVTPVKEITIPRCELIAATLATRLSKTVIESLGLKYRVYYWTDSSVVLCWLKNHNNWGVFVTNRVREIRETTSVDDWRHVPGHLNPADLPSRGTTPNNLLVSRWWEGPEWLLKSSDEWPTSEVTADVEEVNKELKTGQVNVMTTSQDKVFLGSLTYFSAYSKIVRMISWMLRLRKGCGKETRDHRELTYEETEYAERVLFRLVQTEYKQKIDRLVTWKDENGIIRLRTKLDHGNESFDFKSPIVLPACEVIIQRLVQERHKRLQHAGTSTLLVNLREKYWIIGARKLVKKTIKECIICQRYKAKHCQTPLASLPLGRTEARAVFEVTGVDLAGPLYLQSGNKCWIVLYTCAMYRAVHLEVVESLSTHDFIQSLRRFIARHGRVKYFYSDNATNFTGLSNSLEILDWEQVLKFSSIAKITWNFIPPGAPWWGGFYERPIGVLKQMLRRVLGRASISLMELQTILCECEQMMNNRPLTYFENSSEELKPLTPAMFLHTLENSDTPDLDEIDRKSLNVRARYCQTLRDNLRQRFRNEYLSTVVHRAKEGNISTLVPGDIVLLEAEGKRTSWPLAIVQEVFQGADGKERVANVRTATGYKLRAFQKLYPLELQSTTTSNTIDLNLKDSRDSYKTRSGRTCKVPSRYGYDL